MRDKSLIITAVYNENGGWTENNENELRAILQELDSHNIRWALSNNLKSNTTLKDWADKNGFNIHYLNGNYSRAL